MGLRISDNRCQDHQFGALIERDVDQISYTYDFGDNWQHSITIGPSLPPTPRLIILDSSRARAAHRPRTSAACPASKILAAMTKPRHPQRKRWMTWYGRVFDPEDIDLPTIDARIRGLARRRTLGKAGYAKSRGSAR